MCTENNTRYIISSDLTFSWIFIVTKPFIHQLNYLEQLLVSSIQFYFALVNDITQKKLFTGSKVLFILQIRCIIIFVLIASSCLFGLFTFFVGALYVKYFIYETFNHSPFDNFMFLRFKLTKTKAKHISTVIDATCLNTDIKEQK